MLSQSISCRLRPRCGGSLIELLAVISIMAVLLAIMAASCIVVAQRFTEGLQARINLAKKVVAGRHNAALYSTTRNRLIEDRYIIVFRDDVDAATELRRLGQFIPLQVLHAYKHVFKGYAVKTPASSVPVLLADSAVRFVEQDQTLLLANVSRTERQQETAPRSLLRIDAYSAGSAAVNVDADIALIDTGVDPSCTDLRVVSRQSFGYADDAADVDGHGTQVACTAAALANRTGIIGAAPGARIWALKVIDHDNSGSASELIAALDFVISKADEIDVANISLHTGRNSPAVNLAAASCVDAGIVVVAAAGNGRRDVSAVSPASESTVISVAALADTDGRTGGRGPATSAGEADDTFAASFSNFGPLIDFLAPGVGIHTLDLANQPGMVSGTSFAAAHVSGLAARLRDRSARLLQHLSGSLSPDEVYCQLAASSRELIPGPGRRAPYPVVNAGLVSHTTAPVALKAPSGVPLSFEPNVGQTDPQVRFVARASGYNAYLTPQGVVLGLKGGAVQRIQFAHANPNPGIRGQSQLPGAANYFIGPDPARWRTDIPTCREVLYDEVYPGIDVLFHSDRGHLRYDVIVAPGADPTQITLNFPDAQDLKVDRAGQLMITLPGGSLLQSAPTIFQEGPRGPESVNGRYVVVEPRQVRFAVDDYDRNRPLIIDPYLVSSWLGGTAFDQASAMTVDSAGNAYITGETDSTDFPKFGAGVQPGNAGSRDIFVTKITAAGVLAYSTYVGGISSEVGKDIAVDGAGNVYVIGDGGGPLGPSAFPTTVGAFETFNLGGSFVAVFKLNAAGNTLLYSAIPNSTGSESGYGITIDAAGNAYAVLQATSSGGSIVATPGAYQLAPAGANDAFIMKINPTATAVVWATFLGGSASESPFDIQIDASNNVCVVGSTASTDFPVTAGVLQSVAAGSADGFVTKIAADGASRVYSTYLGGSNSDVARCLALDAAGNAYVGGTTGPGFITTAGAFQTIFNGALDGFVTKINPTATARVYSTFLGGSNSDQVHAITVDGTGNAYVAGQTFGPSFPSVNAVQLAAGGDDGFVAGLNAAGNSLFFSTAIGGSNNDWCEALALDPGGAIWVAGRTGSGNFPAISPIQAVYGGAIDGFVAKLTPGGAAVPGVTIVESFGSTNVTEGGATDTYTIVLDSPPLSAVAVSISGSPQLGSIPSVIFAPGTWNSPQTVTVTAVNDFVDEGLHTQAITHTVTSADPNYQLLPVKNVVVNITDNDIAGVTINQTGGTTDVTEGGSIDTYTVVLTSQPTSTVTINLSVGPQLTLLSSPTLTFTPGGWSSPWTVAVRAFDDPTVEGAHKDVIKHTITSSDPKYAAYVIPDVTANITDNDFVPGVIIKQTSGTTDIAEGGATDTYTIELASPPSFWNVVIWPSATEANLSPFGFHVFTTSDWNVPRTITVTAINDNIAEGTHTATISHAVSSLDPGYDKFPVPDFTATITDNDVASVKITQSGGSTDVDESSFGWDIYTVELTSQPTAPVTVTLNPGTQVTSVFGNSVTFSPLGWSFAQNVLIRSVDDSLVEGNPHTFTITHTAASADPKYDKIAVPDVIVNITDNDFLPGVIIVPTGASTDIVEGGASDTYLVKLLSPPNFWSVNITPVPTQATVSPGFLSFNPSNWDTFQPFTVTAINDAIAEGPHTAIISHKVTSLDSDYNNLPVADHVANITDDDFAGVTILETGGGTAVAEGGISDSYTIVLKSQPLANVTITFTGTQLATPPAITFTGLNWSLPRTVTVTALDDAAIEGTHAGTISHAVVSADAGYDKLSIPNINVTITDNDFPAGVAFSKPAGVFVAEGGPGDTYDVVLIGAPSAPVTINISGGSQAMVVPTSLTFTPANWSIPKKVTVTAIDDTKREGDPHFGALTHTSVSADLKYSGLPIANVPIIVTENDFPPPDAGDTSEQAMPLGTMLGLNSYVGLDTLRKKNGKFDDDWYSCTMGKTGTLTVNLSNVFPYACGPSGQFAFGDVHFRVYRVVDGTLREMGASQTSGKTISMNVAQNERILIWVYGLFFTQADYDFSVDVK